MNENFYRLDKEPTLTKQTYSLPNIANSLSPPSRLHLVCYTHPDNNLIRPINDESLSNYKSIPKDSTPSVLLRREHSSSPQTTFDEFNNGKRQKFDNESSSSSNTNSNGSSSNGNGTTKHGINVLVDTFSPPPTPPHNNSNTLFINPFDNNNNNNYNQHPTLTPPVSASRIDFNGFSARPPPSTLPQNIDRRATVPYSPYSPQSHAIQAGVYAATVASDPNFVRRSSSSVRRRSSPQILNTQPQSQSHSPISSNGNGFTIPINLAQRRKQGLNTPTPIITSNSTYARPSLTTAPPSMGNFPSIPFNPSTQPLASQRPSSSHASEYPRYSKYMYTKPSYGHQPQAQPQLPPANQQIYQHPQQHSQQHHHNQRTSLPSPNPPPPHINRNSRNSITSATSRLTLCDEDKRQLDSLKFTI